MHLDILNKTQHRAKLADVLTEGTNMSAILAEVQALSTAQIGKCGELLVQLRLLRLGIESSAMATDTGIDLVAYSPATRRSLTIQVKTNLRAKPGGGKGALALDWWMPAESPAELFALVELETDRIWLFSHEEVSRFAQQKPEGRLHFYLYTDDQVVPRGPGKHIREFADYLIEKRVPAFFQKPDVVVGDQVLSS